MVMNSSCIFHDLWDRLLKFKDIKDALPTIGNVVVAAEKQKTILVFFPAFLAFMGARCVVILEIKVFTYNG